MVARPQQLHEVAHLDDGTHAGHLLHHEVLGDEPLHDLGRVPAKKRHLLQVDVDVVQALVEVVADPLRHHERHHQRKTVRDLVGGLDEDDREADGHADDAAKKRRGADLSAWRGRGRGAKGGAAESGRRLVRGDMG